MSNEERNLRIDEFLNKFDQMLEAAIAIDEFKWKISVSISSNSQLINDRIRTINGINEAFTKHEMNWSSNG